MVRFASSSGMARVDILAHSMGGLVTSAFMKKHALDDAQHVDKVITCGTPYEGAPKMLDLICSDRTRESVENPKRSKRAEDRWLRLGGQLSIAVKRSLPSIPALLPSPSYIAVFPFYSPGKVDRGYHNYALNTVRYPGFLKTMYGDSRSDIYEFHIYHYLTSDLNDQPLIDNGTRINYLASLPNTYFVVGTGQRTLQTIGVQQKNGQPKTFRTRESAVGVKNTGDGTVPYESATMMGALTSRLADTDRYVEMKLNHGGTINNKKARVWIEDVLRQGEHGESEVNPAQQSIVERLTSGAWHRTIEANITVNEWLQFYPNGEVRFYTDLTWLGQQSDVGVYEHDLADFETFFYKITDDDKIELIIPAADRFHGSQLLEFSPDNTLLIDSEGYDMPYARTEALY